MSDVVAAPVPVKLDGQEYFLSPLTDEDYSHVDNWVRVQIVALGRQSLTSGMTQRERDEAMRQAFETATPASWLSALGIRLSSTLDGIAKYLSLSLTHKHPDMTFERVRTMVRDAAKRDTLMDGFDLAQGTGSGEAAPENPPQLPPASLPSTLG